MGTHDPHQKPHNYLLISQLRGRAATYFIPRIFLSLFVTVATFASAMPVQAVIRIGDPNTTSLTKPRGLLAARWEHHQLDDRADRWLSGNGNTGQLISMSTSTSPTQGKIGGALSFNGSTSYIDGGNFADNPSEMTVSAWIKTSTLRKSLSAK
jgi:hypothetical protein